MKILVTGSGGQLGSELQALATHYPDIQFDFTDFPELDLSKKLAIEERFKMKPYDYCINCAAYTAVDKAEEDKEMADKLNFHACETIAGLCNTYGTTLIHISTDFVFSGEAHRPLKENYLTNPVNYYGLSKLKGENAITGKLKKHFILRTSWLYSTYGNNFVKTMLKLSQTRDSLNIIADQIGTPTYARDLAAAIMYLVSSRSEAYGVYHYSNEGTASWYDFTKAIFEYTNTSTEVNPIPTEQYPTPAKRPHYSVMDKSKFKETFGLKIPHWRESLKECLAALSY